MSFPHYQQFSYPAVGLLPYRKYLHWLCFRECDWSPATVRPFGWDYICRSLYSYASIKVISADIWDQIHPLALCLANVPASLCKPQMCSDSGLMRKVRKRINSGQRLDCGDNEHNSMWETVWGHWGQDLNQRKSVRQLRGSGATCFKNPKPWRRVFSLLSPSSQKMLLIVNESGLCNLKSLHFRAFAGSNGTNIY